MKISYSWLKDYLSVDITPERLSDILTSIGLEVDSMEIVEQIPGGLEGVVVAHVLECVDHPDSDHLHITKVDIGSAEPLQVVCGASNVAAGQKVFLATVGTRLPAPDGGEFKIKKSKIRGVESFGMICAEDELGIGTSHDGIMVLDQQAVPGTAAKDFLKLETEVVYEIGLTPNRIDAASHYGVARDVYAYLKTIGQECSLRLPEVSAFVPSEGKGTPIEVLAGDGAPIYSGVTIRGIKVQESPQWLKKHLLSVGLRPINNIVDITNYVMHEIGLPLHAFDLNKIEGGKVVVRRAAQGEKFVTLDGVERELSAEDLMICDACKPMCLAGVFGGEFSGITCQTTDLFLECAYFNPVTVRKSSKRHGIKTDASFRYERGVDPFILEYAAKRAALLVLELAGGHLDGGIVKCCSGDPIVKRQTDLDFAQMEALIGKKLGAHTIMTILENLEFTILDKRFTPDGDLCGARVEIPSYRVDVTRQCDVVEEVLRIYGYNNIELPCGVRISATPSPKLSQEVLIDKLSSLLCDNGFNEIMNNSLTKGEYYASLTTFPQSASVKVLNPLSSDLNVMRQTLLMNGLEVIAYNINRQCPAMKLFEVGSVYSKTSEGEITSLEDICQQQRISLFMTGAWEKSWNIDSRKSGFFALKGYFELMMARLGADLYSLAWEPAPSDLFAEGVAFSLQGRPLAVIGTISGALMKKFSIKQPVYAAEISVPALMELAKRNSIRYKELPKFPEVRRDMALLLDESVSYADMYKVAFKCGKKLLKRVGLFDVYRGDKIPQGKKQYALSFVLQDVDRTLTDKDVEKFMEMLLNAYTKEFGAQLR